MRQILFILCAAFNVDWHTLVLVEMLQPCEIVVRFYGPVCAQLSELLDVAKSQIVFMEVQVPPIAFLCGELLVAVFNDLIHDLIEECLRIQRALLLLNEGPRVVSLMKYVYVVELLLEIAPNIGLHLAAAHHRQLVLLTPLNIVRTYHPLLLLVAYEALACKDVTLFPEHGVCISVDHEYLIAFPLYHSSDSGNQDVTHHTVSRLK